jgi:membrane glycosyltransferase
MARMKMRQSINQLERAFLEETQADRARREALRRQAVQRSRQRQIEHAHKQGTWRFTILVLTLLATAAIVTVVMFRTLYLVMG